MLPRPAVLHALLLLVLTIASSGAKKDPANDGFQTINFAIDWTGGVPSPACNSCVSTSFACSDGRGTWDGGVLNFMDPFEGPSSGKTFLPIAVNLTINGYFNCNGSAFRQMYLLMQVRSVLLGAMRQLTRMLGLFDRSRHDPCHTSGFAAWLRLSWMCQHSRFTHGVANLAWRYRPLSVRAYHNFSSPSHDLDWVV